MIATMITKATTVILPHHTEIMEISITRIIGHGTKPTGITTISDKLLLLLTQFYVQQLVTL